MAEEQKIQDSPTSEPVFVNVVLGRGMSNNVVNVTLATYFWSPYGEKVDPDLRITSRLRMDLVCAVQLRDTLNELLDSLAKSAALAAKSNGVDHTERETIN